MGNLLQHMLPASVRLAIKERFPRTFFGNLSYSQEGEDLILMRMFENVKNGFYVDVGAHHPFRFSNTCLFYKRGWRGIVIDPLPGMAARFKKYRPGDIAIEKGISSHAGVLKYHVFNEGALNTLDESLAAERQKLPRWQLLNVIEVQCMTLRQLLDDYLPVDMDDINFLSVDVEGYDLSVLQSNDWVRYRPLVVVAECLGVMLDNLHDDPVAAYMRSVGYLPFAKAFHSVIFRRNA